MPFASTTGAATLEPLPAGAEGDEYALMSMRLTEGMDLARYQALAGEPLSPERSQSLTEDGLVETVGGRIRATAKGRPLLNAVLSTLLT